MGGKNLYSIFAGGHHSWVTIDDLMPVKEHYRPPSPVGFNGLLSPNLSPRSRVYHPLSSNQISRVKPLQKYPISLHVSYSDTSMCHRFITFEFSRYQHDDHSFKSKEALDEYIKTQY